MSIKDSNITYLNNLILTHSGNALRPDQKYLFETRLQGLAESLGYETVDSLIDYLALTPFGNDHRQVIELMMTHETLFFRDPSAFDLMRDYVIPELSRSSEPIRIWSAACSSGQEIYSLAILLNDEFPSLIREGRVHLDATDLAPAIVERASKGLFHEIETKRGLTEDLKNKYFIKQGALWKIRDEVCQQVRFSQQNLLDHWHFIEPLDLILVRYVLIYFDPEGKRKIVERMINQLRPGGFLFAGGSESLMGFPNLKMIEQGGAVCYQKL